MAEDGGTENENAGVAQWVNIVVPVIMVGLFVATLLVTFFTNLEFPVEKLPKFLFNKVQPDNRNIELTSMQRAVHVTASSRSTMPHGMTGTINTAYDRGSQLSLQSGKEYLSLIYWQSQQELRNSTVV
ncbi:hypothetical protein ScPMuIL_012517 [Solemya velum]